MKTWYLTREGSGDIIHKGKIIPPGHKIYLSEQQAKLHQEKIIKTEPPDSPQGTIILEDYFEHLEVINNQKQTKITDDPQERES